MPKAKKAAAPKKKVVAKKKEEMVVHADLIVKGTMKNTIEGLVNKEGFHSDQFGNKIYATDSKENQDRLKALGL